MDVHAELGRIDKRVERLDAKIDDIREDISGIGEMLKAMGKNEARLDEVSRLVISHDKRITAIEKECSARGVRLGDVEDHVEKDVPIDAYTGKMAKKILWIMAGAAGAWLIERLPKIIELLK